MTRTGKTPRLSAHYAEPFAEIHPEDAERFAIKRTQLVRIENALGSAIVRAQITDRAQKGSVFVPMHWTGETAPTGRVNALVASCTDPVSGQPALKMARVSLAPVDVALYGFAVSVQKPQLHSAQYWALAPAPGGWRAELGFFTRPDDIFKLAQSMFRVGNAEEFVSSVDARSGRINLALFDRDRLVFALYLSPDPVLVSRQWAVEQLGNSHIDPLRRAQILVGRPGADRPDPGPLVCSCFGVGANTIADAVIAGCHSVDAVGASLNAGTNCGSCRTEIRRLIDAHRLAAAQ